MIRADLAGFYKLEAVRPDGSRRVLADWFPNLVLDAGLDRMGTGSVILGAAIGTGSSTPVASQTADTKQRTLTFRYHWARRP